MRNGKMLGELPCRASLPFGLGGDLNEVAEVALEPQDLVLFYTDGVVEGRQTAGVEAFGLERLGDLLVRHVMDGMGLAETLRRLVHAVLDHHDHDLRDDATMVLLEYRGSPANDRS
jgi:serine phosphatase RsbU (regulator of sigma subunit)